MKAILSAAFAGVLLFTGSALAGDASNGNTEPLRLTAAQLDSVTAGVGANNVATQPWDALLGAGFSLNHNNSADAGADQTDNLGGVAVPSAVPNSDCIAFC